MVLPCFELHPSRHSSRPRRPTREHKASWKTGCEMHRKSNVRDRHYTVVILQTVSKTSSNRSPSGTVNGPGVSWHPKRPGSRRHLPETLRHFATTAMSRSWAIPVASDLSRLRLRCPRHSRRRVLPTIRLRAPWSNQRAMMKSILPWASVALICRRENSTGDYTHSTQ